MALALFLAAPFNLLLGRSWNRPKVYLDEQNEEFEVRPNHTLFWIPMQHWSFIFVIIGVIALIGG